MLNKISEKEIKKMIATVRRYKKLGYGQKRIVEILKKNFPIPHRQALFFIKNMDKFLLPRAERNFDVQTEIKKPQKTRAKNDAFFRSIQGGRFSPR